MQSLLEGGNRCGEKQDEEGHHYHFKQGGQRKAPAKVHHAQRMRLDNSHRTGHLQEELSQQRKQQVLRPSGRLCLLCLTKCREGSAAERGVGGRSEVRVQGGQDRRGKAWPDH